MNSRGSSWAGLGRENEEIVQSWGQRRQGRWLLNDVSSNLVEEQETRANIRHVCRWPAIEDGQLDLELLVGRLEEELQTGCWMIVEVARAGDIDV